MENLDFILDDWKISKSSNLIIKRIKICNECEYKNENTDGYKYCNLCGCSLNNKIQAPSSAGCPIGKWELEKKEKRNLRFLCAQPASIYYAWQIEVLLNNFLEMGINLNNVDIVCWKNGEIPTEWMKLANNYAARFFFYDDNRKTKYYISSIRPNILKQHFLAHSYLSNETIFYHDCDIIFTKPISEWITEEMINDDNWYGSNVLWYISYDYILSKGEDVLDEMCKIVKIDRDLVKQNSENSIGAQYLMKNIDYYFWDRIETDCENLFNEITKLNQSKKQIEPKYHELQIWCADMWALLWNAWKMNFKTILHPNFDFSWGTSNEEEYLRCNIMHNAGVVNDLNGFFYKANYINKLPFNQNLDIKKNSGSWHYYEWIKKTEKKSVLL